MEGEFLLILKEEASNVGNSLVSVTKLCFNWMFILIKVFLERREFTVLFALLALTVTLSLMSPYFLTVSNLINVSRQVSIQAIIAISMTFIILTAGIDLSVGAILALGGCITASALKSGMNIPISILLGLLIGTAFGSLNGVCITKVNVPPFIMTLGMMYIARGIALFYTRGQPISGFPRSFVFLGQGYLGPVPTPVVIMAALYLLTYFILAKTRFGRYTYAIGGNKETVRLLGINITPHLIMVYAMSGCLSALSGIILTARLDSSQPTAGLGYELNVIAAVVIGGTSLFGGRGRVEGTLIGAFLIGVIRNGLNLLGVSPFLQVVVIGFVIVLAAFADIFRQKK